MTPLRLLPLLALLAACNQPTLTPELPAPRTDAERECVREAEAAAPLNMFMRRTNVNNVTQRDLVAEERRRAKMDAYIACMNQLGAMRGGGVERVQR
jgi:hypothetical protein